MFNLAFVPATAGLPSTGYSFVSRTALKPSSKARVSRHRVARMCEKPETAAEKTAVEALSAAEKTRRALAESEPLVNFRRDAEYLDKRTESVYTKDVESGVDIWLITGILTFLVPLVGFAIGVATGNIDVSPR